MPNYYVIVNQTKYPDYPCMSGYDISAPNSHDAEQDARQRFSGDTGFDLQDTVARPLDKHLTDIEMRIILPIDDDKPHDECSTTCECEPLVLFENGQMIVVHQSFDGREQLEALGVLPAENKGWVVTIKP